MLRLTEVNLKRIGDIEKYQSAESTISDGISMICKGYAEANKKFLKLYDANRPYSYIIYLDANDLYEHPVKQLLPTEILEWVTPKGFDLDNYCNNSPIGFSLEVDLDYRDELHNLHNDCPLVGEKIKVRKHINYKS